ncbi:MAG TPA: Lpg1974 family pore-forming outer membrane protein [Pirellulales bacterium]
MIAAKSRWGKVVGMGLGLAAQLCSVTVTASENLASPAAFVERLPPVAETQLLPGPPSVLPSQPTELSGAGSSQPRGGSSLLSGGLFGQSLEQIDENAPLDATQSVAWSALEIAQSTLSQGYYAGADYLLLRPHFSEPVAFMYGQGNNGQVSATMSPFDFNYQSSPRVFLGYRSPVTGAGVQFTYWHFQENAGTGFNAVGQNAGFIPNVDIIWELIGQGNNNNNNNGPDFGNQISAQMHLRLNVFDIDFFKPVALGAGRWLLTGSVGARIMDFSQSTNTLSYDSGTPSFTQFQTNAFTGAGPRATLEARRNFGPRTALYMRGGYGMLLGGHTASYSVDDIINVNSVTIRESLTRMVSVADIEFGGSWRASDRLVLSAGYMFQFWTDLGGTGGILNLTDNSNILSFDGLVTRASFQF